MVQERMTTQLQMMSESSCHTVCLGSFCEAVNGVGSLSYYHSFYPHVRLTSSQHNWIYLISQNSILPEELLGINKKTKIPKKPGRKIRNTKQPLVGLFLNKDKSL